MKTIFSVFVLLALPGCSLFPGSGGGPSSDLNEAYLTQHWISSYEEQEPGGEVDLYRPAGYKEFPPRRFRMQYIFLEGGSCQWLYLGPTDGHYFKPGRWQLLADNVLQIEQGEETVRYHVVELAEDLLRIERIRTSDA